MRGRGRGVNPDRGSRKGIQPGPGECTERVEEGQEDFKKTERGPLRIIRLNPSA